MAKITRDSLMTLEAYARERPGFRARVMAHKQRRRIELGLNVALQFEDELTMRYQVQEMLRAERIFEEPGIQEELETYNPLVPDGRNFKATMMLEYPDPGERSKWLEKLIGIEDRVWLQVEGCQKVWAIADEDLERETPEKTSSVHFLRLELDDEMIDRLKRGMALSIGIDHPLYQASTLTPAETRGALVEDLA
jgi:hypothetical protein